MLLAHKTYVPDKRKIFKISHRKDNSHNPPNTTWCVVSGPFCKKRSEGRLADEGCDRRCSCSNERKTSSFQHDCHRERKEQQRVEVQKGAKWYL